MRHSRISRGYRKKLGSASEKSNCCLEKEEWELREKIGWFRVRCWGRDGNGEAQKTLGSQHGKEGRGQNSLQAEV